jgi:membrane protein
MARRDAGVAARGSPPVLGALLAGVWVAVRRLRGGGENAPDPRGHADVPAIRVERMSRPGSVVEARAGEPHRGRQAETPSQIEPRGWWDILLRAKDAMSERNLLLIAAGAAFYGFLAIPAGLTGLVALYGLVASPADVGRQIEAARGVVPGEVLQIVSDQLQALTTASNKSLGIGFVVSLLVALWSARSATAAMVTALDVAYDEPEKRGMIRLYATTLGLTVVMVLFAVVALLLVAVLPAVLGFLPLGAFGKMLASVLRWPVLLTLVVLALAVTYRYAPSRKEAQWRWVSWGAAVAALLWTAGSALFSLYVSAFASYNKTYGSLGGVVVLLMWLYVSAVAVLLGAQLNAEMEHQTVRDTTESGGKPLGQRGAKMADTVGEAR